MTIIFDATRPVKPARPFGRGVPETEGQAALRRAFNHMFPACDRRGKLDGPDNLAAPRAFEPSPEDRAWWAAECDRMEDARYDTMAAESAALDRLEAGLCH